MSRTTAFTIASPSDSSRVSLGETLSLGTNLTLTGETITTENAILQEALYHANIDNDLISTVYVGSTVITPTLTIRPSSSVNWGPTSAPPVTGYYTLFAELQLGLVTAGSVEITVLQGTTTIATATYTDFGDYQRLSLIDTAILQAGIAVTLVFTIDTDSGSIEVIGTNTGAPPNQRFLLKLAAQTE